MSQPSTQPLIRMPMLRLVCVEALAWLVSGAGAIGFTMLSGQGEGAWMGGGATLVGLIAGLLVLVVSPEREAFRWATAQVGASTVRMLVTLMVGFGIYTAVSPDKIGFWAVLMVTSLAVLAGEVMVFLPVLRRAQGARTGESVTEASV